eukprot:TRINITY_DN12141_c0_g1_i1.p1 TRINITY_DN12141_c0_g1~~TRINITY_DN12141_c0_g1_i1.p1  ORF type:complete len:407 (-),score=57.06 TRINITY_DN12141_c0_g1_i1:57-1229(-)
MKVVQFVHDFFCTQKYFTLFAFLLLLGDFLLNLVIIQRVAYTEIDWKAYMQEVEGFLDGEYDYMNLKGDTGPLVYPAGFVYIYSLLYRITNGGLDIRLAQYIFAFVYSLFSLVVFAIYYQSKNPPWLLIPLVLSKRLHSIFVLRLFNDVFAMLFLYIAIYLFNKNKWSLGCILFSLGVSVKMNVLLFAPGLFLLLLNRFGFVQTILKIVLCGVVQLILGAPFLLTFPYSYLYRSFELGRKFFFKWTVNWRFIDEGVFLSSYFAIALLILHLGFLLLFFRKKWSKNFALTPENIVSILFTSNFIGIIFCRTLHYQFYVWYFHTIPYLLYHTIYHPVFSIPLMLLIENSWLTFPSTIDSSLILFLCHSVILFGVYKKENVENVVVSKRKKDK